MFSHGSTAASRKKFSFENVVYLTQKVSSLRDQVIAFRPPATPEAAEKQSSEPNPLGQPERHNDPAALDIDEDAQYAVICEMVETLRELVEVVVWGDKHDESVFFVFLEQDCMQWFEEIVVDAHTPSAIKVQVIQCITILLQNLTNQPSVFSVCSNNHINRMIQIPLDSDDEELLSNYTSFLKSICLRLNNDSVQFFFQSTMSPTTVQTKTSFPLTEDVEAWLAQSFPLLSQSVKLLRSDDSLVRAAARQIVITVMQLQDAAVVAFLEGTPVLERIFETIAEHIKRQLVSIGCRLKRRAALTGGISGKAWTTLGALDTTVEDLLDDLYYLNDLFDVPLPRAAALLLGVLKRQLLSQVLLPPCDGVSELGGSATTDTDESIPPSLCLLIIGHWLKLNTVEGIHHYLVNALFPPEGGVIVRILSEPKLMSLHSVAVFVLHSVLCSTLTNTTHRANVVAGCRITAVDDGDDVVPLFTYPIPNASGTFSSPPPGAEPDRNDRNSSLDYEVIKEGFAAYTNAIHKGRHAEVVAKEVHCSVEVSPLMKALAASLKEQAACKELLKLNTLTLTVVMLLHVARSATPFLGGIAATEVLNWLRSVLSDAIIAAQLHLVRRAEMYRQHLWVLFGSIGESTVLTPSSLLCQLLARDTDKELEDPYEVLWLRLERDSASILSTYATPVFPAALVGQSGLAALHKMAKDIANVAPLMPPLACWNSTVFDRLEGDIKYGDKHVSAYLDVQQRSNTNVALPRRAPHDEDEVEYVEVACWLLLRHVLCTQLAGLQVDPLVAYQQQFACKWRPGAEIRSHDLAALITDPGVRCEYTPDPQDDPLSVILHSGVQSVVTPGTALYLFLHESDFFLVEPSRESPDTRGMIVASYRALHCEALIHSRQLFKLHIVQEAPTSKQGVCVVLRDRTSCQQVARRIQKRAAELRRDACALLHELLIKAPLRETSEVLIAERAD